MKGDDLFDFLMFNELLNMDDDDCGCGGCGCLPAVLLGLGLLLIIGLCG